jgi:phage-related protein
VKPLVFIATALDDLRAFSPAVRREAGYQPDRVQRGLDPNDWKPMASIGPGVREVRLRDRAGAFRVIYLAARPEAVYVLHAFQKKSQATSPQDLELSRARFREL